MFLLGVHGPSAHILSLEDSKPGLRVKCTDESSKSTSLFALKINFMLESCKNILLSGASTQTRKKHVAMLMSYEYLNEGFNHL